MIIPILYHDPIIIMITWLTIGIKPYISPFNQSFTIYFSISPYISPFNQSFYLDSLVISLVSKAMRTWPRNSFSVAPMRRTRATKGCPVWPRYLGCQPWNPGEIQLLVYNISYIISIGYIIYTKSIVYRL